ncbi:acyl-CoA dehydrogenase family protein [Alcaligenaceae bacterium]|nr:acyl-CoA dehydrogenase family protein [Alcaligenaceae bacterium]
MIRDQALLRALLEAIERFVREQLVPAEQAVDEADEIPPEIVQGMKDLGLCGMSIPQEYGGLGLTTEEEVLATIALCHASPAFRSLIGTTVGIGSQGILMDGTAEQKERFLPALAGGETLASFALTEPEAGSDAASLRTSARRVEDAQGAHYLINGTKRYITNAPYAGLFTVMARTGEAGSGAKGVTAFIVDGGTPGISFGKRDRKMGQKGSHTCDVMFDEVKVPVDRIIGGEAGKGQGFRTAMKVLDKGRLTIAAVCVGAAERMLNDALRYAMERRQFGQPIAQFQLVQAMLADSRTEIYAARSMLIDAARRRDEGERIATQAACCKLFASEMCGRVADRAVQIFGGAGYVADSGIERFYRDVRLFRIFEGTSQIQQLVIARNMLREANHG